MYEITRSPTRLPTDPTFPSCDTVALEFDERAYLAAYDDVSVSLDLGEFATAREHFECFGKREGRLTEEKYLRELGLSFATSTPDVNVTLSLDTIVSCRSGTVLIVGWVDDRDTALSSLSVFAGPDCAWNTTAFICGTS